MKKLAVLLLLLPLIAPAQSTTAMFLQNNKELHIRSVTAYQWENNEKVVLGHTMYDTSGRLIRMLGTRCIPCPEKNIYDTLIYGETNMIMLHRPADSTVATTDTVNGQARRVYTTYKNGIVERRRIYQGDSIQSTDTLVDYKDGKPERVEIKYTRHTYDKQGRVTTMSRTDTLLYHGLTVGKQEAYYEVAYTDNMAIRTEYTFKTGKRKISRRTYTFYDHPHDSTIYYTGREKIDHISVSYTDSQNSDSVFRSYATKRRIDYSITWTYTEDSTVRKTFDEKGNITYQLITTINDRGLISKESGAGIEGSEVIFYEYTFYE